LFSNFKICFRADTNYFFDERSAQGVFLADWVKRLLKDDKKLRNLHCDGDCGAPF